MFIWLQIVLDEGELAPKFVDVGETPFDRFEFVATSRVLQRRLDALVLPPLFFLFGRRRRRRRRAAGFFRSLTVSSSPSRSSCVKLLTAEVSVKCADNRYLREKYNMEDVQHGYPTFWFVWDTF